MEFEAVETKGGITIARHKKRRIEDYSQYCLTDDEIRRILDAAASYGKLGNTYAAIVQLMLFCGLRRHEVINLRVENVDFENGLLRLKITKRNYPRASPMPRTLRERLLSIIGERKTGVVLMHEDTNYKTRPLRPYSSTSINLILAKIGRKAGIKPKEQMQTLNPHLLRHTWVRLCLRNNISRESLKLMGGWRGDRMLDNVYGIPDLERVKAEYREKFEKGIPQ